MFELAKGDPEKLEGKVIGYGKFVPFKMAIEAPPELIAKFCSKDIEDLVKYAGVPRKILSKYRKKGEKETREIRQKTGLDVPAFYSAPIIATSEVDLELTQADVIFTGEYKYQTICDQSIDTIIFYYCLRYREQHLRRDPFNEPPINKNDCIGRGIRSVLDKKFVIPMINEQVIGRYERLDILKDKMKKFCTGSWFEKDAAEICGLIQPREHINRELIDAYLERIAAINCQEFMVAEEITKKIQKFAK